MKCANLVANMQNTSKFIECFNEILATEFDVKYINLVKLGS